MSEQLGSILFYSLIGLYGLWRFVLSKNIPALTHTESAPVFLGSSQGNRRIIGFLDLILIPKWMLKEWSAQLRYNSIELENGEILKSVLVQETLDDYFRRNAISGSITDLILCKNQIVAVATTNGNIYSLNRFSDAVSSVAGKKVTSIN